MALTVSGRVRSVLGRPAPTPAPKPAAPAYTYDDIYRALERRDLGAARRIAGIIGVDIGPQIQQIQRQEQEAAAAAARAQQEAAARAAQEEAVRRRQAQEVAARAAREAAARAPAPPPRAKLAPSFEGGEAPGAVPGTPGAGPPMEGGIVPGGALAPGARPPIGGIVPETPAAPAPQPMALPAWLQQAIAPLTPDQKSQVQLAFLTRGEQAARIVLAGYAPRPETEVFGDTGAGIAPVQAPITKTYAEPLPPGLADREKGALAVSPVPRPPIVPPTPLPPGMAERERGAIAVPPVPRPLPPGTRRIGPVGGPTDVIGEPPPPPPPTEPSPPPTATPKKPGPPKRPPETVLPIEPALVERPEGAVPPAEQQTYTYDDVLNAIQAGDIPRARQIAALLGLTVGARLEKPSSEPVVVEAPPPTEPPPTEPPPTVEPPAPPPEESPLELRQRQQQEFNVEFAKYLAGLTPAQQSLLFNIYANEGRDAALDALSSGALAALSPEEEEYAAEELVEGEEEPPSQEVPFLPTELSERDRDFLAIDWINGGRTGPLPEGITADDIFRVTERAGGAEPPVETPEDVEIQTSMDDVFELYDRMNRGETLTSADLDKLPREVRDAYLAAAARGELVRPDQIGMDEIQRIMDRAGKGEVLSFEDLGKLPTNVRDAYLRKLYGTPGEQVLKTAAAKLNEVIQEVGFDAEKERRARTDVIERRYQDARERLARQFGIDPGGEKTGRAQRAFESLEISRQNELSSLEVEISQRAETATQKNTELLTSTMTALGGLFEETRQFNETLGLSNKQFNQRVTEFNEELGFKLKQLGLDETRIAAVVRQIDAEITNSTRATSAQIGQQWADLMGGVGVEDQPITAADLGVSLQNLPSNMPGFLSVGTPEASALRASYQAMTGQTLGAAELARLLEGRSVLAQNMPTLKARELAANVSLQEMERIAKYGQLADELELDRDKFNQAVTETDRQWSITTLNVAQVVGLDETRFQTAKFFLDSQVNQLFFQPGLTAADRQTRALQLASDVATQFFPDNPAVFLRANELADRLYGDQRRQIATTMGVEAEKFEIAMHQVDQQETRFMDVWSSLFAEAAFIRSKTNLAHPDMQDFSSALVDSFQVMDFPPDVSQDGRLMARYWLDTASDEQKEAMRSLWQAKFGGNWTDRDLLVTLGNWLESGPDRTFERVNTRADWFSVLEPEEQQAFISLLNGTSFSPERQGPGMGDFLQSLGQIATALALRP